MSTTETMNDRRQHCIACQRPMRPRCTPRENYPGTVLLEAKGMCAGCYVAHRKAARAQAADVPPSPVAWAPALAPVLDGERVFYLLMERARFEASRRRRRVPEAGLQHLRIANTVRFLPLVQEVAA